MRRLGWLVCTLALAGCGDMESAKGRALDGGGAYPCDGGGSLRLEVSPQRVARGEDVPIVIAWQLGAEILSPSVTLLTDSPAIEVEVPLSRDPFAPDVTYTGEQRNPFGMGAAPGAVSVLAEARKRAGCDFAPSAAASFALE